MILFLTVYLLVYGSVHLYFFFKIKPLLAGHPLLKGLVIAFLALMLLAPILVHSLERMQPVWPAKCMSYLGYSWMALLFLFFSISLLLDLYRVMVHFAGLISPALRHAQLTPEWRFWIPLALAALFTLYGYYEAAAIRVERLRIPTDKLAAGIDSLKIAQISDVHVGLLVGEKRLGRILDLLEAEHPDVLVSTGDLVEGSSCDIGTVAALLGKYQPRLGKYAVTGNHEFYHGLQEALSCTKSGGFRLLANEAYDVGEGLMIVGVHDEEAARFGLAPKIDEGALLDALPDDRFILYLRHQPRVHKNTIGKFDLMLSGHTHRGQIFPFRYLTALFFTVNAGLKDMGQGSLVYVNRGTGTWGPPIRLLAPPEVTVIELVRE